MVNVVTIAAYRRIYWLRLIGLVQRSAATWCCVLHSSDEPGEISQWQWYCYDDSTINIVVAIIIIIIKISRVINRCLQKLKYGMARESKHKHSVSCCHLIRPQYAPCPSVRQTHIWFPNSTTMFNRPKEPKMA